MSIRSKASAPLRPAHPATVIQRRHPPHAATIGGSSLPPHPAKVAQRTTTPHAAELVGGRAPTTIQPMWSKKQDDGLSKEDAQALYKKVNQQTNSEQKQKAIERLKIIKQERGKSWDDYLKHNNLNAEGLPKGNQTLFSFGSKVNEKKESLGLSTENKGIDWGAFKPKDSITIKEFLSEECLIRLQRKYGDNEGPLIKTLEATSEREILLAADLIVSSEGQLVYKGDIGEVLSASAKGKAGWLCTTHQFDSAEHGLDVISFSPTSFHVAITGVKYWPSGLGVFTLSSLPKIFQSAVENDSAEVVKKELISVLESRKAVSGVRDKYLKALSGGDDVSVSWEIEIIGDDNPKVDKAVLGLVETGKVTIVTHSSVTMRLLTKALGPKHTKAATGDFGVIKKQEIVELSDVTTTSSNGPDLSDPDVAVEYGPWHLHDLKQLEETAKIKEMKEILLYYIEKLKLDDDDPYFYNGVLRL